MTKRFNGLGRFAWPLSMLYGIGNWCHRMVYQSGLIKRYYHLKPVISIGNIIAGGSGKTPMTVYIAQQLIKMGKRVVILLRGYKAVEGLSDEAMMIKELLPDVEVLIGKNRVHHLKKIAQRDDIDMVICDDAFQHWPIERNLDIVLIDSTNPFGNRLLLPAGILREPVSSLRRANVIILTKSDDDKPAASLAQYVHTINPQAIIVRARHQFKNIVDIRTGQDIELASQQRVLALCAIADPDSFLRTVMVAGLDVVDSIIWEDHAPFNETKIDEVIQRIAELNVSTVIMTHKDAVKIKPYLDKLKQINLVCLNIEMDIIDGKDALVARLALGA